MNQSVRQQLETFLAGKGLRRTKQRDVIIEAAFGTKEHFNADDLHEMARRIDRTISRATVYRTLGLLQEGGFVESLDIGRGELVYEHILGHRHHDHMVCLSCGRIE